MISLKQLAVELGTTPNVLRQFIANRNLSYMTVPRPNQLCKVQWMFTAEQADAVRHAHAFRKAKRHPATPEEIDLWASAYRLGIGYPEIAEMSGMSPSGVHKRLVDAGVIMRSAADAARIRSGTEINDHCFDSPLSDEGAYFVGLLMADGCIYRGGDKRRSRGSVSLGLLDSDRIVLEQFLAFCGSNRKITTVNRDTEAYLKPKRRNERPFATTGVSSLPIIHALASYGVVPKKSMRERVIGLELNDHFWRGMIDGDGSVITRNELNITLVGSRDICQQFCDYVRSLFPVYKGNATPGNCTWQGGCSGWIAAELAKRLYRNDGPAIPRKRMAAEVLIAKYENNPPQGEHRHVACTVPECGRPHRGCGYCGMHYQRFKKHGDPLKCHVPQTGCDVAGCTRPHAALGYCDAHHRRFKLYGDPLGLAPVEVRLCSIAGCGKKHKGFGYCELHYQRFKQHGDPLKCWTPQTVCSIAGCGKPHKAQGYCDNHYRRFLKYGDALAIKKRIRRRNSLGRFARRTA